MYFKDKYVKSRVLILKKTDEKRNYLLDGIKNNDLTSEKYKKTFKCLNYVEHSLILALTIISCVSNSASSFSVCVPVGIIGYAVGIKICAITVGIKRYKSIINQKKKKQHKIFCY